MSRSMQSQLPPMEVRSLDTIRPEPAKAGLQRTASDRVGPSFNEVVKHAVIGHYGSVKAAAYALGDVDPSLMRREFDEGKFGRLSAAADHDALQASIADAMRAAYGTLDPKRRARQALMAIRQRCDELEEAIA